MLDLPVAVLIAIVPFGAVIVLLEIAACAQRFRDRAVARQIALTDLIHERLGPVAAPVVRKRPWGPWEVDIPVPFACPETVTGVIAAAHEAFPSSDTRDRAKIRIVLTQQERAA
jgi:hypothetical protein